jgi:hypothetical protein
MQPSHHNITIWIEHSTAPVHLFPAHNKFNFPTLYLLHFPNRYLLSNLPYQKDERAFAGHLHTRTFLAYFPYFEKKTE